MTLARSPLRCLAPRPAATRRLVCLPYAGGSSTSFRGWADLLDPRVEPWAYDPPGHAARVREPFAASLRDHAAEVAHSIGALPPVPTGLFGHSMGAWVALETARLLEGAGRPAILLVAGGRHAPGSVPSAPQARASDLPDAEFLLEMQRRYGGLPPEVAGNPEIMEVFLPILRADVRLLEEHRSDPTPLQVTPILVITGEDDAATPGPETHAGWRRETVAPARARAFPGGHFFIDSSRPAVVETVAAALLEDGSV